MRRERMHARKTRYKLQVAVSRRRRTNVFSLRDTAKSWDGVSKSRAAKTGRGSMSFSYARRKCIICDDTEVCVTHFARIEKEAQRLRFIIP